nr:transposase, MuDR, MULE transposase domain protein [Tanacetum cinerariifolium]
MKKFNLEANYPLNLFVKLSSIDDNFDITDDHEVRFFVECACNSKDEVAHLHAAIALAVQNEFPLAYHDPDAYDKLCQVGPHRWSRAHCPLVRYNYLTLNYVKSINACTVVYRKLPVIKLAETYRAIVEDWYYKRRKLIENMTYEITDWAANKVQKKMKSAKWVVCGVSDHQYQVYNGRYNRQVDFHTGTCQCRKWQLSGLPCGHVIAVIKYLGLTDCLQFVSDWFKKLKYQGTYAEPIQFIRNVQEWEFPQHIQKAIPPRMDNPQPGRPKNTNQIQLQGCVLSWIAICLGLRFALEALRFVFRRSYVLSSEDLAFCLRRSCVLSSKILRFASEALVLSTSKILRFVSETLRFVFKDLAFCLRSTCFVYFQDLAFCLRNTAFEAPKIETSTEEFTTEKMKEMMQLAPVEWKLYDLSEVHHLTAKDKEIFILVEKDYPLRKEVEKDDLNQKFFTSLAPEWLMHTIVWRNRNDLDTMSLDDLYNHLKVYEAEVQKKSNPNSQNMAFISSSKHSSGDEDGNTACLSTSSTTFPTASASVATISQDTASAYIASQSNASTSAEGQNKNYTTSEDVASPKTPKPFVKFVKPKDSQSEKLEELKLEKDGLDGKLAGLLKASRNLDNLIESQRPSPTVASTSAEGQNKDSSTSEDVASPNTPKPFIKFVKPKDSQSESKTNKQETPKKPQVKYAEQYRHSNKKPNVKGNQRNWNNLKSYQLGLEFVLNKKACFNCGDFSYLANDCRKMVQRETT